MQTRSRVFLILITSVAVTHGQQLTKDAKGAWASISGNVVKAAEKMPDENYSFRPTDSVRSFGQVIGPVTDANYLFCSAVHTEKKSPAGAEKQLSSKADLVSALKESVAYCTAAFEHLTDAQAAEPVKLFGAERAKLSVLYMNIGHANEHYGNIVTYMRLKSIVPPSSEPRPKSASAIRLDFDRAHGELPVPTGMEDVARKLNLDIVINEQPLSAQTLNGGLLLYLRAPSKTFTETEQE